MTAALTVNPTETRLLSVYSISVYKEHLAAFQLSLVLIFTTCFTKFRESSNVNPNTSLIIVTSGKAAPSANRWLYIGFRARTSTLHFSVFKIILFSRNHFHTSLCFLLRFAFFHPIREFFSASEGPFLFSLRDINLTLGLLSSRRHVIIISHDSVFCGCCDF